MSRIPREEAMPQPISPEHLARLRDASAAHAAARRAEVVARLGHVEGAGEMPAEDLAKAQAALIASLPKLLATVEESQAALIAEERAVAAELGFAFDTASFDLDAGTAVGLEMEESA